MALIGHTDFLCYFYFSLWHSYAKLLIYFIVFIFCYGTHRPYSFISFFLFYFLCYVNEKITRRLKSFPWDALVYGNIMAFYLNVEKLGKPERCVML